VQATAVTTSLVTLLTIQQADAFIIKEEKTNTCADWNSNTNNENERRYHWFLGFVHGTETAMYPDRKDSRRGGRIAYLGSKEVNQEITKQSFINAIDKACKDLPGYPLSDGIAELIMNDLNLTTQSRLAQEPYMLEISVCNGKVESFIGNGELVEKGVQMINLDKCSLFAAERNSSIGRQILKECPLHSRCHVEAYVPGDSGIQMLVEVERIK
jgi:hypothetical protein